MKLPMLFALALVACLGVASPVFAQTPVPPPGPDVQLQSSAELDQLLSPIALYPDPLIAQILPASTFPPQIVLADRYVGSGGDPNQIDQQPWDASVRAMAHYPNVLKWMDENLSWTTELGEAFLNQQQDVMASIQRLRASAQSLGNLQSTPQEQVIDDGGEIEIVPTDSGVMYVPVYQPDQVYYLTANGSPFITFDSGWPMGLWLDCDFDWGNHNLIFWNHDHPRPANWWHQPSGQRQTGQATVWSPRNHPGAGASIRGDRGWGGASGAGVARPQAVNQFPQHNVSAINVPVPRPAAAPIQHSEPSFNRPEPVVRAEPSGALIGIQSTRDTKSYSDRGRQSVQAMPRPSAPAPRPESSGGGGRSPGPGNKR